MREAGEPTRRLFFAFWPDPATREELVHACRKAVKGSGGRPVKVQNLHATLAFLGSVAEARLAEVEAAGAGLGGGPIELVLDGIEFWPKPQVLVAVCGDPPAAVEGLARQLWQRLAPLEIEPDLRPYRPHVTLARKVRSPAPGLAMRPVRWPAADVALVESVTDPAGARYAVLKRWPLEPG